MPQFAAFLRGMNVGGRRITNRELTTIFEGLGCTNAAGFLASGNMVFDGSTTAPDHLRTHLEQGLQAALSYSVPTYLRTGKEVVAIAQYRPFSNEELAASAGKMQVMFLPQEPSKEGVDIVTGLSCDADRLVVDGREIYWLPVGNLSDSTLPLKTIERAVGPTTIRTHRTIVRLVAKFWNEKSGL